MAFARSCPTRSSARNVRIGGLTGLAHGPFVDSSRLPDQVHLERDRGAVRMHPLRTRNALRLALPLRLLQGRLGRGLRVHLGCGLGSAKRARQHPPVRRSRLGQQSQQKRRHVMRRMYADDTPVRLARSWFPAQWASGTALAHRPKIRGGVTRLVEKLRRCLAYSDIDLEPRKPSDEETELLGLGRGIGVVQTVTTFMDEAEGPVFVQEEIADASRHRWRFRVTL